MQQQCSKPKESKVLTAGCKGPSVCECDCHWTSGSPPDANHCYLNPGGLCSICGQPMSEESPLVPWGEDYCGEVPVNQVRFSDKATKLHLEAVQQFVGGPIEIVTLPGATHTSSIYPYAVVNEEGGPLCLGLPVNERATEIAGLTLYGNVWFFKSRKGL